MIVVASIFQWNIFHMDVKNAMAKHIQEELQSSMQGEATFFLLGHFIGSLLV